MAGADNLIGKGFKPGQSGNIKGRPLKIYTILKKQGYGADDIKSAFNELSFYNEKELSIVGNDKKRPVIVRIIARQLEKALSKKDMSMVKDIAEHILGKPTQAVKVNGNIVTKGKGFFEYYEEAQKRKESEE